MPKYINADELLKTLPDDLPYKGAVKRVLIQAPEADVVEVTRCKDCQYSNAYTTWQGKEHYRCTINDGVDVAEPTHFCSYGEKENT